MVCIKKNFPPSSTSNELVFLQAVEYNSYFAGACISWRRDANGGAWQPHYRITDHLGSTRLETSANGTITAAYDYNPFGEQIPLMTTTTRKTYIGIERDNESYLGDIGVRKYDYAAGRFTSPDVLWEKYMDWSPYQYCGNNPLNSKDETGMDVKALDEESKSNIVMTLPPTERDNIVFQKNGMINENSLMDGFSYLNSSGYLALTKLVVSDQLTTVETSNKLSIRDGNTGKIENLNIKSGPYGCINGFTATPSDPENKALSLKFKTTEVTINSSKSKKAQVEATAHELFLHALFYISGKDAGHWYYDKNKNRINNTELNNLQAPVVNEASRNYEKK